MTGLLLASVVATSFVLYSPEVTAQDTATSQQGTLLVFLDCNAPFCDFDHFRREITWVNWVRDRRDAAVHLLLTAQVTGGGGWDFTLDFLGLDQFNGKADTLKYVSDPDDTDAEVRDGLTQTIAVGLVRFAAATAVVRRLRISYEAPAEDVAQAAQDDDPWNLWVFRINANGSLEGEAQQREHSIRGSASANRTSEAFKINWRVSGRYSRDEFDIDDSTTVINTSENYGSSLLMVWSLTDHWSAGGTASADRSTFRNLDLRVSAGPTIEYNIFPYEQSTRRALTFRYAVEIAGFDYELITVAGQTAEILPRHVLQISADVVQPWGNIFGSVSGAQYLHDLGVHRIDIFGFLRFRVFRGLSFNVGAEFSRIKDQFFLPAGGLDPDEILLQRRARETDFSFELGMGFSYRFGSKFANIVNPRMGGRFF